MHIEMPFSDCISRLICIYIIRKRHLYIHISRLMQSENGILLLFYIFLSHGNEKKNEKRAECCVLSTSTCEMNIWEHRKGNQKWTIQRHFQRWSQDTEKDKQNKNTTQKIRRARQTPPNTRGEFQVIANNKQFLFHIRQPSCYTVIAPTFD
jgi:hypothetical protein